MNVKNLPSVGVLPQSISLRREAANAISQIQVQAYKSPDHKATGAAQLKAFFLACAAACTTYVRT